MSSSFANDCDACLVNMTEEGAELTFATGHPLTTGWIAKMATAVLVAG